MMPRSKRGRAVISKSKRGFAILPKSKRGCAITPTRKRDRAITMEQASFQETRIHADQQWKALRTKIHVHFKCREFSKAQVVFPYLKSRGRMKLGEKTVSSRKQTVTEDRILDVLCFRNIIRMGLNGLEFHYQALENLSRWPHERVSSTLKIEQ